jgi:DNA-binding transcriptional ArsR family regulator
MLGLEDLLGRKGRVRVLRVLAIWDGLNIGRIMRLTGLSWGKLDKILRKLVEEGILRECRYSFSSDRYVRMFRYADTPKARILKRLFREWENLTHQSKADSTFDMQITLRH